MQSIEDDEDEEDETFLVYVTESPDDLTESSPARYLARATGTIRDDDGEDTVSHACTGPTVSIPDAALRQKVEQALDKTSGAPITPQEMGTLRFLRAGNREIEYLTGLQCATGLARLELATTG